MAKQEEKIVRIKILPHPGNANPDKDADKLSGVQTSEGDVFEGDVIELPEGEARLIIGANRAIEDPGDAPKRRTAKEKA
jgi:hypothetical protein